MGCYYLNKGQAATEFIILVGVSLLFLTVFSIIGFHYSQEALYEERREAIASFGFMLQQELFLITTLREHVVITRELPQSIDRFNYEIVTSERQITISSADQQMTFATPPLSGSLQKGPNTLTYEGVILIS